MIFHQFVYSYFDATGRPESETDVNLKDVRQYAKILRLVTKGTEQLGPTNGIADTSSFLIVLINATQRCGCGSAVPDQLFIAQVILFWNIGIPNYFTLRRSARNVDDKL